MQPLRRWMGLGLMAAVALSVGGCGNYKPALWRPQAWWQSWLDPTQMVVAPEEPDVVPIVEEVDPVDEYRELVPNAVKPTMDDLVYTAEDYRVGAGDILRVSVLNLLAEGVETVREVIVTNTGYISLPLVPEPLYVEGMTMDQVRRSVIDAYQPEVLLEPVVSVLPLQQRQDMFSILGAVQRPSTYQIPKQPFRLLEALALAGDVTQANIEWVYVIRPTGESPGMEASPTAPAAPAAPAARQPMRPEDLPPLPGLEELPPAEAPAEVPAQPQAEPAPGEEVDPLEELRRYMPQSTPQTEPQPLQPSQQRSAQAPAWIYQDGQWTPTPRLTASQMGSAVVAPPPVDLEDPFGWAMADMSNMARIIAVNLPRLRDGEARLNIVVRPGDIVHIPPLTVGEFYMMGEVARPGVYNLTGRRVTVKMALAAAGNLSPLGWPSNSILIRRVGTNQEIQVPLNLDLIMAGKEPDIFLKPNDVVAVGSHILAPFLAVARNAFRMTYGFGFIYDRNFANANLKEFDGVDAFGNPIYSERFNSIFD